MGGELEQRGPNSDAGVTLIELMVVVALMAVLAVGASIAATGGRGGNDLALFRTQFETSRALAIQSNQRRGLFIATKEITPARITLDGWKSDTQRNWTTRVTFRPATFLSADEPSIQFLPNGQTTAFSIAFASGHTCQSDGWTGLQCDD